VRPTPRKFQRLALRRAMVEPVRLADPVVADPVRVLYIGGWGRSGSTLLDLILGQLPGVISAGEVREIWKRGCREDGLCGCGEAFSRCPFWHAVGERAFGGWSAIDLDEILRWRYEIDRPWRIPALADRRSRTGVDPDVRPYLEVLGKLYRAIRDVADARVVVDSSNLPSAAFLLRRTDEIDLRVVHLVRDSRGVAFSWQQTVPKQTTFGPAQLPRYGVVAASLRWTVYNALTRSLRRLGVPYLLVRYEDLVAEPMKVLTRVGVHAGIDLEPGALSFIDGREVGLRPNHTVEGNPMRVGTRHLVLRSDERWKREMSRARRGAVALLTLPSLRRYGYELALGPTA
jgi:hypothetical protein